MRSSYLFDLRIRPRQPLAHGEEVRGTIQTIHRLDVVVRVGDHLRRVRVPCVSGAAFRARLREAAVLHQVERYSIESMPKDRLRLLLKGGLVAGPRGQSIGLDAIRRMQRLFPALDVFGAMDNEVCAAGLLDVSPVLPWVHAVVDGGMLPRDLWVVEPAMLSDVVTEVTEYRHDVRAGRSARLLPRAEREAIEDREVERAVARQDRRLDARERRQDDDSMPHTTETIAAGTPMGAVLRLQGADEVALGCLLVALARWRAEGARLGGANARGFGACSVEVARAVRVDGAGPVPVEVAGTSLSVPTEPVDPESRLLWDGYHAHLDAVMDEAVEALR